MPDIRFSCPGCDKKLVVDGKASGKTIQCPDCSKTLRVPWMDASLGVAPLPKVQPDEHQGAQPVEPGPTRVVLVDVQLSEEAARRIGWQIFRVWLYVSFVLFVVIVAISAIIGLLAFIVAGPR